MLLISHRGNINGPNAQLENSEDYIETAINNNFDVEIDLWYENQILYLGHDKPTHKTSLEFLSKFKDKLWIHCKNFEALNFLSEKPEFHFFWHQDDNYTLTSRGIIWTHFTINKVGKKNVLVVFDQISKEQLPDCYGICSDFVNKI